LISARPVWSQRPKAVARIVPVFGRGGDIGSIGSSTLRMGHRAGCPHLRARPVAPDRRARQHRHADASRGRSAGLGEPARRHDPRNRRAPAGDPARLHRGPVAGLPPHQRIPFFVHVDEFQTFSSDAFASLLRSPQVRDALALANQYTGQLPTAVRSAVIGNAGTLVVFRVGGRDSDLLAPEFRPMDSFYALTFCTLGVSPAIVQAGRMLKTRLFRRV
jgi:hypothetical protein